MRRFRDEASSACASRILCMATCNDVSSLRWDISSSAMCRSCTSSSWSGARVTLPKAQAAARRTQSASSSSRPMSAESTRLSPREASLPRPSVHDQRTRGSRSLCTSSSKRSTTSWKPSSANLPRASTAWWRTKASGSPVRVNNALMTCTSHLSATFSSAFVAERRTPLSLSSKRESRTPTVAAWPRGAICEAAMHANRRTPASASPVALC
mmetsp:Transcript_79139/g.228877  ORF Transcript_79139/g.228877 Transcript_79139/m.228877 type:complete len:211 (+) Transcript_79139:1611-2243(+)